MTETRFGAVSDTRVVLAFRKLWPFRASRTEIPLTHVSSVQSSIDRRLIWGAACAGMAILTAVANRHAGENAGAVLGGAAWGVVALYVWIGSPRVVVTTTGGGYHVMKGRPWDRQDANVFVAALMAAVDSAREPLRKE